LLSGGRYDAWILKEKEEEKEEEQLKVKK